MRDIRNQTYGDLTELNTSRIILDSVGRDVLGNIAHNYIDLLGTSSAIYEKNGDYALGIFSSNWCKKLDESSRALCNTDSNKEALASGKWLCHESCWTDCAKVSIETGKPVSMECTGGLHIFAVPIIANKEIIGSINFGYGQPPQDASKLNEISEKYAIHIDELKQLAESYESVSPRIIANAQQMLLTTAALIGSIIERKREVSKEKPEVSDDIIAKWQKIVDLLAKTFEIPVAVITKVLVSELEAFVVSASDGNPYSPGDKWELDTGMYCEHTMKYQEQLLIPNALEDPAWDQNPDIDINLVAYLGVPIIWPDGEVFGTFCILDNKNNKFSETSQQMMEQFRTAIEADLKLLIRTHELKQAYLELEKEKIILAEVVDERTKELKEKNKQLEREMKERESMKESLIQSQKMESISTLAGGIAHDFNNLLGVITGNVSYSLSQLNQGEELFEVLSDVQEGAKQAQNLTQQLLTFAKGGEPVKKTIDLNQLLKKSSQFAIRGANSRCEFEFSENLFMTKVDSGQINQVINNLMINANQAMPHGGIIHIKTENTKFKAEKSIPLPDGQYIKFSIKDQGIGISEKNISNIFDPFFTTKQKGSGLGLSTVYSIIQKHNGHIAVYSEIDKGTIFHVYLPASSKDIEKTEGKSETTHQGQGNILIMDDQEPILKMMGRILNRMGYETAFAIDGSQAIEMYKKAQLSGNSFDLVILDLTIPGGLGGAKTIPELLKIDPKVKAVVSSGYSNDPIMANYEAYGFCGVVPKPYTKAQLSEVLNRIFRKFG